MTKGAVNLLPDSLVLDSKTATQAQLRIYLYTKDEHTTPSVSLVGVSVRAVDVIPERAGCCRCTWQTDPVQPWAPGAAGSMLVGDVMI